MYSINFFPKLSWSKINLFLQCPRCFYKEQVLKMKRPGIDPDCFSLNNAVDELWKREFNQYRKLQLPHPIMTAHQIDAVPFMHESLSLWRDFRAGGIRYIDRTISVELYGVIDDIWINPQGELIVIDFKTTTKQTPLTSATNKRQLEFYAYLFKMNGFSVHDTGYLIYSTALKDKPGFGQKLEFVSSLQACSINDAWVAEVIKNMRCCLAQRELPATSSDCNLCKFELPSEHEINRENKQKIVQVIA